MWMSPLGVVSEVNETLTFNPIVGIIYMLIIKQRQSKKQICNCTHGTFEKHCPYGH